MNNPGDNDKTRIKAPANNANDSEDKTRFAPPKKSQPQPEDGGDKTQIKNSPTTNEAPDKTRIKSVGDGVDKTRVIPKKSIPQAEDRPDKTRFIPPKRPAQSSTSPKKDQDVTRVAPDTLVENSEPASDYGIIKNRFVFEELLGAGGMGVVYKA